MSAFIDLEQVWFSWPSGREVLRGVDLTLQRNDTLALMGSNGSGKTTLGKLIMGLLQPTAGKVCLDGRPVQEYSLAERGRRVGYVFQNPERQFFASSVADEIGFALGFRGFSPAEVEERVAELLAFFELEQCPGFSLTSATAKAAPGPGGSDGPEPEFVILTSLPPA